MTSSRYASHQSKPSAANTAGTTRNPAAAYGRGRRRRVPRSRTAAPITANRVSPYDRCTVRPNSSPEPSPVRAGRCPVTARASRVTAQAATAVK
ncbi:hypothetical protein GCM10023238_33850 [Streptomyces heliomycini]